jgi:bacterioferritin
MYRHWGLEKLGKKEYEESIGEMKHADKLIERMLMLDGLPNVQLMHKIMIGENTPEMLKCDLKLELGAQKTVKEGIAASEAAADYVSRDLLLLILDDTEEHIDWLETQIVEDRLEQVARDVIGRSFTGGNSFLDGFLRAVFQLQVALQYLGRVLADHDLVHQLHVRQAVQHQDALDQLVGMLHFADRLFVFLLAQLFQSPVPVHAGMQKVLVDRGEFIGELRIEQLDDVFIALHGGPRK